MKHWQAGAGKKVAILGIGDLRHVAIRIAKAMGADVTVLTTDPEQMTAAAKASK